MKWIETFRYALNKKDINTMIRLINNIPEFNKIEDMRVAYACIDEVKQAFEKRQLQIQKQMNRIH